MRDAEEKLEIVLDAMDALEDGILVLDGMARYVAANKGYYDLVLTPDQEVAEGESSIRIAQRISNDKRVEGINQMEPAEALLTILSSTFSYVRDYEATLTDGRILGINAAPAPKGNMVMWFREKSPERIGEQRALGMLSDGLGSVDMGMILWSETLIVQSLNASWQSLITPVQVGENCRDMFSKMIETGRLSADHPIYESDLDQLVAELHRAPMRLNYLAPNNRQIQIATFFTQTRGVFATAVDVTEHRSAQERARAMLSDVVQALDLGVMHFDADHELQLMNRAAREIIYPDHKVPSFGTSLADFAADLASGCISPDAEGLAADLQKFDTPFRPQWTSGRVIEFCAHRTDMGGIMISIKDLTEVEALQAELIEQREVAAQNDKLSALGELLAEVAHELSNPMSVVLGYAQMLGDQAMDDKSERRVARIVEAAERCSKVLKMFLAMARQRPAHMEPCDVRTLIDDALDIPRAAFRSSGIELILDIPPDLPKIEADGDQIIQVLINLLMNALQELSGLGRKGIVHLSAESEDGEAVIISVADNGDGVPEKIRRRIFEPFFTTKDVGVGTGIGLAFCHRTINSHGGTISVGDSADGGAVFQFSLPTVATPDGIIADDRAQILKSHKTVLILDDEAPFAEMIKDMLNEVGVSAETYTDGWAALDRAQTQSFDCLFVDMRMPGLTGQEFFERLKAEAPQNAERLVFLTGDALNASVASFLEKSGQLYLEKPVSQDLLLRALHNITGDP